LNVDHQQGDIDGTSNLVVALELHGWNVGTIAWYVVVVAFMVEPIDFVSTKRGREMFLLCFVSPAVVRSQSPPPMLHGCCGF
jgi:hypothetical protein